MLTLEQNRLLTRTGPATPMGDLMRRYWIPALLSEEVAEPDGPPVAVRLLGEELVAFRDSRGRLGLLEEHCAHRGTSLVYGRNEDCGLRCIYHGWKFDFEGRVVDTPAERPGSDFRARLRLAAYPCHEAGGIVFAYLGPPELRPPFPPYSWTTLPTDNCYVTKCLLECNYLQGLEGECDSAHLSFLHSQVGADERRALFERDHAPHYEVEDTDFGVRLIALRNAGDGQSYLRVSSFVLPLSCWVPARNKEVHLYAPLDDTRTWRYDLGFLPDRPANQADLGRRRQIGPDYRRLRRADNGYLQDRTVQRTADYTGIDDFLNEDACATESMGIIADRTREHLGVSDRGVIAVRHRLLGALRDLQAGREPHRRPEGDTADLSHIDTLVATFSSDADWRQLFPHLRGGVLAR